jgi:hypothetical protein
MPEKGLNTNIFGNHFDPSRFEFPEELQIIEYPWRKGFVDHVENCV